MIARHTHRSAAITLFALLALSSTSARVAAQMSEDVNCLWYGNGNSSVVPTEYLADGEPYYRTPNALNSYPVKCGMFVNLYPYPSWEPRQTSVVVDLIAGRTTDPTTCAKIEVTARLWKTSTLPTGDIYRVQAAPVVSKTVLATWDGTRCKAPITFSKSVQVTQADIDDYYENMIQARAVYRTSSGSVVRVPFMVRTTFTGGKWVIAASSATKSALGVSTWRIWFTRPNDHIDSASEYGGDPSRGGQPLDFAGNDYSWPSLNYHIRDTRQRYEDNSAIVMQGFDAAGKHVGFISYRLDRAGNASIAYSNRNDSGWWSDTIESNQPLRESVIVWASHMKADLESSGIVVAYSCDDQLADAFFAMLGAIGAAAGTAGAAILVPTTAGILTPIAYALIVGGGGAGSLAVYHAATRARQVLRECRGECKPPAIPYTKNAVLDERCCIVPSFTCGEGSQYMVLGDPNYPSCTCLTEAKPYCRLSTWSTGGTPNMTCGSCSATEF